jgi:HAD superfamily hydrolase (TIGR01509 family)
VGTRTGCILDFDGVIVDSEPAHAAAKRLVLEWHAIPFGASLFDAWKGRTDVDFFAHVAGELAPGIDAAVLLEAKRVAYREVFGAVSLVDGIEAFLAAARAAFPRLGVATSATVEDVGLVIERFGLRRWFDTIVTSADTTRHKPDPEPYLVALARLGLQPAQAVAVDDSPNGVRSAHAAGLLVIGLEGAFDAAALLGAGADRVAADLATLTGEIDGLRSA